MLKAKPVIKPTTHRPHPANRRKDKKTFSHTADLSQKINSDNGPRSLMRGGIRL